MITIEEVKSIKKDVETYGITPSSFATISALCALAISQHEEIERLRAELSDVRADQSECNSANEWQAREIERLQNLVHNFTAFVERQAFKIPAPNPHTPALVEGVVTARLAIIASKAGEPK